MSLRKIRDRHLFCIIRMQTIQKYITQGACPSPVLRIMHIGHCQFRPDFKAWTTGIPGEIDLVFSFPIRDRKWFREIPVAVRESGVTRLELVTWGWWLGDSPGPKSGTVIDQIACHLPNPLTGSVEARNGMAFINMRDAYQKSCSLRLPYPEAETRTVVLWHTASEEAFPETERKLALDNECLAASPYVAPWAVGARHAGLEFCAHVVFPLKTR